MENKKEFQKNLLELSRKLDMTSDPLEAARQMQQDWLTHGTDFVRLYVEDVDGDWLENWGEDDEK